ncbi:MAG: aldehyde dehydrogenase [Pseudomonadota bacterium]
MQTILRLLAALPLVCAVSAASAFVLVPSHMTSESGLKVLASTDEPSEYGILKVANGVDETFYACTPCHSERIVAQQGLTREGWDELLVWMVEEQGMVEIEEPDRTTILDYLEAHYNEDRPNFPD